ncbi:hypothetical protein JOQ06_001672 [Pogonophryne albipinna]|uniref:LINE-1 type transposase domain-containing 1 n=1 Tax=Pogonophryne albipinna TaxID=1090488 RepID=A0AAD6FJC8_9TELE|nr:hypothetical protein JOQ06_001672 [Pogonophryne albipinna]
MSLENFWPQSFDKMGRTQRNRDKKDTAESEPGECTQDGDQAESVISDELDPALAKALNFMTANIIKVIDDKLSPLVETIHNHSVELQSANRRLDEAETRIMAVENSATVQEPRIAELEKQVSALAESLDMAENYNRPLNIRVVGLAEGTETGQPVDFFESWLPLTLGMATKAGRIKLERAHCSLAPRPDPNKYPRSVLLRLHTFRDKQKVMEAARRASQDGALTHNGSRLSFYSDFSPVIDQNPREDFNLTSDGQFNGIKSLVLGRVHGKRETQ